jgi:hypothetical protein
MQPVRVELSANDLDRGRPEPGNLRQFLIELPANFLPLILVTLCKRTASEYGERQAGS